MLDGLQYRILKRIAPREQSFCDGSFYAGKSKLEVLPGKKLLGRILGKTVIDFGRGAGNEAVELAQRGARRVIGIDINRDLLEKARRTASRAGVESICQFATSTAELADVIVSIDAFEHFEGPAQILRVMHSLLHPGGEVIASFGPKWYHPLGGHTFSVFPWAHLLFSEKALIRWRSDFKTDGATRFGEVAGGLNQMTIGKFEKLVEGSALQLEELEAVPIQRLKPLHNRWTREFTSASVRCRLAKGLPA